MKAYREGFCSRVASYSRQIMIYVSNLFLIAFAKAIIVPYIWKRIYTLPLLQIYCLFYKGRNTNTIMTKKMNCVCLWQLPYVTYRKLLLFQESLLRLLCLGVKETQTQIGILKLYFIEERRILLYTSLKFCPRTLVMLVLKIK